MKESQIAFMASVISRSCFVRVYSGPNYVSLKEAHITISEVAIKCHKAFEMFPPEDGLNVDKIVEWAKHELTEKYKVTF